MNQPLSLAIDHAALDSLIASVVERTLAQVDADRAKVDAGQLCYSEEEAARLLFLEPHVLGDERRRGRIAASQIVGRRIRYTRDDLLAYLAARRFKPKATAA